MSSTCHPQPRSLELFQFLGIFNAITKAGIPAPAIRMYKPDGVEVLKQFEAGIPHLPAHLSVVLLAMKRIKGLSAPG